MSCGIDMVHIPSFAQKIERTPQILEQLFDASEQPERYSLASLAGNVAAKEAVMKALYQKFDSWHTIRVYRASSGAPYVQIVGEQFAHYQLCISISHDHDYAIACAVVTQM